MALKLYIGSFIVGLIVAFILIGPLVAKTSPTMSTDRPLLPPSQAHPLGTDNLGRDVLARLIYGGRVPLEVAIFATIISSAVGVLLGMFSGYIGRWLDRVLTMIMDSLYAFPGLLMAMAIAAVLGPSPLNATLAIGFVYIPTYYRLARNETQVVKTFQYIEAARALGASTTHIVVRHILPTLILTIVVVATINLADAILTEAALAFFGYTVVPPTPDWGADLSAAKSYILNGAWWLLTPGLMIVLTALGFSLLGDGLAEKFGLRKKV
ncbi:MAG: ABC transporter permease [Thermoproteus sp.]